MPTYPSSGKIGGEIIKLYQSRCFHIKKGQRSQFFLEIAQLGVSGFLDSNGCNLVQLSSQGIIEQRVNDLVDVL